MENIYCVNGIILYMGGKDKLSSFEAFVITNMNYFEYPKDFTLFVKIILS
jgi:hypothetical protein